jgi:hypothetical protein
MGRWEGPGRGGPWERGGLGRPRGGVARMIILTTSGIAWTLTLDFDPFCTAKLESTRGEWGVE